jgi:cell volume regulation protein A
MGGFCDGLSGLIQVLIFFLLGLLARPALLHKAILPALAISAFMLLVARPVAVFSILTPFRKYSTNQQELISFVGLRGAASIVFAIMAITGVDSLQTDLFNTVFCIVLISISIQGTLIPWVSRKLDMIDANANVMKTFNDYTENSEMQFSQIGIGPRSAWAGKQIMELGLPKNMLIALVIRGQERIIARGDTKLCPGDKAIVVTKTYVDTDTYLMEKTIKPGSKREGHTIGEFSDEGLVLLVRRGDKEIIPNGSTVLQAGDNLVILKAK